jgi:hypothetical protein
MAVPIRICLVTEWDGKLDIQSSKDREIIAKSFYFGDYRQNLIMDANPQLAERISNLEKDINEWLNVQSVLSENS